LERRPLATPGGAFESQAGHVFDIVVTHLLVGDFAQLVRGA